MTHEGPWQGPPVGVVALVRFIGELVMLVALGYVGWQLGGGWLVSTTLTIALPAVAIAVWGRWVAPRAKRRLPDPLRFGVELVLVALTAVGLVVVGTWAGAIVLVVLYGVGASHGRAGG